jgi:hypothetical protein
MRFLMFVCLESKDAAPTPPNTDPGMGIDEWVDTMDGRGARLIGDVLVPAKDACAVRVRGDEVVVTDGPFVETKEVIAGFDVLEATDMKEAIEIAAAHPMAREGVLELRAFAEFD